MRALQAAAPRLRVLLAPLLCLCLACGGSIEQRLDEARALQDAGQFRDSVETLRAILRDAPDNVDANYLLGLALLQSGDPSPAVWPLERASETELAKGEVRAGLLLVTAYLQAQSYDDAVRAADRVLKVDPKRTSVLRMRAEANLDRNKLEDALADTDRLLEIDPDDFQGAMVHGTTLLRLGRRAEAEKAFARVKELGAKSGDPTLAARGWLALAYFYQDGDLKRAEAEYRACLEAHPTDPVALQLASDFFDAHNRAAEGNRLYRHAIEQAPENLGFRVALANRLAAANDRDGGEKVLREAADSFASPVAWQALAEFQRRNGNLEGAQQSLDKVVELSGGKASDPVLFTQADLLVDLKQLDRAEELSSKIGEQTYRDLIHGRVLLERGDAKGALAAFDSGIRRWPNNPGARYLAGLSAERVGDFDRAVTELREAVRADAKATDASLELGRLYLLRGQPMQSIQFLVGHLQERPTRHPETLVLLARAQAAAGHPEVARDTLTQLAKIPGQAVISAVELASVEAKASGPAAALATLEKGHFDLTAPANEPVLRAEAEQLLSLGKADRALALVDAARAKHPQQASLVELRGTVLARANRTAEARQAFEQALAMDAKSAGALSGLASLTAHAGDVAKAVELYDRAAQSSPDDVTPAYAAAQLVLAQGQQDDAMKRLEEVIRRDPGHASSRNDLAWLLAERGQDLDRALALAQQAEHLKPTPEILDTVGWVHLKRGEAADAEQAFQKAVDASPGTPTYRYHLGLALIQRGDKQRAQAVLRDALGGGPFPEAAAAREELARLEQR